MENTYCSCKLTRARSRTNTCSVRRYIYHRLLGHEVEPQTIRAQVVPPRPGGSPTYSRTQPDALKQRCLGVNRVCGCKQADRGGGGWVLLQMPRRFTAPGLPELNHSQVMAYSCHPYGESLLQL